MMNRRPSPMKLARLACGFTLRDVAEQLGVSNQAVSLWELGKRKPDRVSQQRLARMYRVPRKLFGVDVANSSR